MVAVPRCPLGSRRGGREPLLDAALAIIAEEGTGAVTVRAVAQRAGASPGTVSYHFPSSETLLVAAIEHGTAQTLAMLERLALDLQDTDWDAQGWADAFAAALAHSLSTRRAQHLACFELQLLAARRPALLPAAERVQQAYARITRMALRTLGVPDLDNATVRAVAMLTGLLLGELAKPRPGTEERLRAVMRAELQAWSP